MSESGILDFSGLDDAAVTTPAAEPTATPETPATDTIDTPKDTPTTDGTGKEAKQQYNSDGTPKDAVAEAENKDDLPGTEKTPQDIRNLLRTMRDADPKNVAAVKQLHGAYERWEAAKAIYPGGVNEMKQAKEFLDLVGGHEGYEKSQGTVAAAEASDAKLYEGNPELIQNIVDDLKSTGHMDALGKLATPFLDALKTNDEKGYYTAFAPHFFAGLEEVNIPGVIGGLEKAMAETDPTRALAAAKEVIDGFSAWYKRLETNNKTAKENIVSPERKQLDADRAAFLKTQEDFKTNQSTEFKNSIAKTCESSNNKLLGAELGPFLKMAFFLGYGKENLMPLGNTIKNNLYETLKADGAYQAQMKAMWGSKNIDRAKIEEYHKARVQSIAKDIVRDTVQKMYPGYAKGGAAAGRVAAAAVKKDAVTKVDTAAAATGKPVYVAVKPNRDALDMDHVDSHGRPDAVMEMIGGRGFLKGSGKWVTWRK